MELHGKDDFVLGMHGQAPWREVHVLSILAGSTEAAAFFEGVDPVTNLTHRIAWLLELEGGKVRKITALDTIIAGVAKAQR
jgi:hypothetical protein